MAHDFLLRHGRHDQRDWVRTLNMDGSVRHPADGLGFAGILVAEGLQEYYRATGNQASMGTGLGAG